jgi:hypothetical protein
MQQDVSCCSRACSFIRGWRTHLLTDGIELDMFLHGHDYSMNQTFLQGLCCDKVMFLTNDPQDVDEMVLTDLRANRH